jgi:hypothetical protein
MKTIILALHIRKYYEGYENALEFDEQRLIRKAAEAFADAGLISRRPVPWT